MASSVGCLAILNVRCLLGLEEGLARYWKNLRKTKWAQSHPGMVGDFDVSKRLLLHIFHDGVKSYEGQEVQVWAVSSATAVGDKVLSETWFVFVLKLACSIVTFQGARCPVQSFYLLSLWH